MASKPDPEGGDIRPIDLQDALSERYLAYALSTITARSLPDVRDGLKPVQRRILYAMRQLRLDPESGYKKCARVVGDVIGKFHPHGDAPVYEALVRLAQDFAQRYPLVDGQGNFGNIDGDNAAAMRYTESRLTAVAQALLEGIDEDTVDFRETYDGSENEPVVLPSAFPNLLANGAQGIAVGMATSIPPHHAGELAAALIHLLDHPEAATVDLMAMVQGPDLPTGGLLVEDQPAIQEAYETGRGGFRIRARWTEEKLAHGQYQIVIDEIPYQVQKARLVERIALLMSQKKLPLIADVRDESTEDVRLVLIPKSRSVPAAPLMEQLFRQTELESRISLNLNVLDAKGVPRVMSLRDALSAFLEHRMEILVRRSRFRLAKIEDRLEVLDGYLKAFLDIDRVIQIIRENDQPRPILMAEFELTERQAEAILNLRLRQLRKLEEMELIKERKALRAERKDLNALLADEGLRRKRLAEEIETMRERFGTEPRRTKRAEAPVFEADIIELPVERQPVTIVCSQKGWIRSLKGHVETTDDIKYKDGDGPRFVLRAQSTDKLLIVRDDGRVHLLSTDRLPGGRGQGEPLSLHIDLPSGIEVTELLVHQPKRKLILATVAGYGFIATEEAIAAQTKAGKQVVNLSRSDKLKKVAPVADSDDAVAVVGSNRKLLVFSLEEMPDMARGKGVILQRYRDGTLSDVRSLRFEDGLAWPSGDRRRHEKDLSLWRGKRSGAGRPAPTGFPKDNRFGDAE
ncbi:MAG: DNA topoisomerase IV subunit A [Geminicoccaceae bacterium]